MRGIPRGGWVRMLLENCCDLTRIMEDGHRMSAAGWEGWP
jgi:hypothetical protein